MKKIFAIAVLLVCGLYMMMSCSKDDIPENNNGNNTVPADTIPADSIPADSVPVDTVRLTKIRTEFSNGIIGSTTELVNTWVDGRLVKTVQKLTTMGISKEVVEVLVYDKDGRFTELQDGEGNLLQSFDYDDRGRVVKQISYTDGEVMTEMQVTAYDEQGNITKMEFKYPSRGIIRRFHFTWVNRDLTEATTEFLTEDRESETVTLTYDDYPNVFTGYPVARCLESITYFVTHINKHNRKEEGLTPTYKNGRLVMTVNAEGNTTNYFEYNDGTGKQEP